MIKKILKITLILLLLSLIIAGLFILNTSLQFKKMCEGELIMNTMIDTIPFTYSTSGHILIDANINAIDKS